MDKLPDKVTEELEQMESIDQAEGILKFIRIDMDLRSDNYLSGDDDVCISFPNKKIQA